MKKIILISSLIALYSCGSNEDKQQETKTNTPPMEETTKTQSTEDIALQEWLQGKVWDADEGMAPMRLLKLKANGEALFYKDKPAGMWSITNGELALDGLTEWPIKKVNDSTFTLYVKPSDTWYTYRHTENL